MADKKNQHYVPQSYLRPWADERDRTVAFIPANDEEYQNISIGNVASSDYFYSKETELEDKIGLIEDQQERVLEKVRNSYSNFPDLSNAEIRYFKSFILFQRFRTNAVLQDVSQTGEVFAEEVADTVDVEVDDIRDWTDNFQRLMKRMMLHSILNPGLLSDLSVLLLIDTTGTHFITSETPILFDNPAGFTSVAGVANAGLQVFVLSPPHTVFCF